MANRRARTTDAQLPRDADGESTPHSENAEAADIQNGSAQTSLREDRLEVWMTLDEVAEATGLTHAVLQYWDVTGKVTTRVVPGDIGGGKEVLLADFMRELRTVLEREMTEGEGSVTQLGLQSENEMLRKEVEVLRGERELVERRADLSQAIADERLQRVEDMEREIKRVQAERSGTLDEMERIRGERQKLTEELGTAVLQQEELAKELEQVRSESQQVTEELEQVRSESQQVVEKLERHRTERQELIGRLEQSKSTEERLARELEQSEMEREHILKRAEVAEAVAERRQRGLDEVKRVADSFIVPADEEPG